jgi:chromosomal replication initiator protein
MVVNGVTKIELPCCNNDRQLGAELDLPYFVAGPENRLAASALQRLLAGSKIDADVQLFSPLVLIGPSGSGKSHLARGIVRRWRPLLGESKAAYYTAVDFARALRLARDEDQLESFRQKLADLSLLVIEDLQRLPQTAFVQRELRDTIDVLDESGGVLVFTSQQPPATITQFELGLSDRLGGGLSLQLRPPEVEARKEILQLAAAKRNLPIDAQQIESLAGRIDGPAPRLLRALAELELSSDAGQDFALVREPVKLKQIVAVVARYYSLTQAALRSSSRRKSLVHARGVVVYLARSLTDLSYAQIGEGLGRRDHTTIMHAQRNIKTLLAADVATQQAIDQLQRILSTA